MPSIVNVPMLHQERKRLVEKSGVNHLLHTGPASQYTSSLGDDVVPSTQDLGDGIKHGDNINVPKLPSANLSRRCERNAPSSQCCCRIRARLQ